MLSDAELLLGVSRHVATYAASPATAALEQLAFAGSIYEVAFRLRGSGVSSIDRVLAIGVESRIGARRLQREVLPALEGLGWINLQRRDPATFHAVVELIPPPSQLVGLAASVLDVAIPTPIERAALELIRATTTQPLETSAALEMAAGFGDSAANEALRHLETLKLVRVVQADDGRGVVFNPNVWSGNPSVIEGALRTEDARVRGQVGALIEEVASRPGLPESQVTSTEPRWVTFAVSQGLVQRTVVQTTEGVERGFLFTPHIGRDPFGGSPADASGHVRQLVGSMVYAATFPGIRLRDPAQFVRALVRDGFAGDASPIGTDYPMLETAGIVRVVPGSTSNRYQFELLQADVADDALRILEQRQELRGHGSPGAASLRAQRTYVHAEHERARLALRSDGDDVDQRRLISALRDSTARRDFRGR